MQYRVFPQTNRSVSVTGFGVWTVATTWWGIHDRQVGIGLLRDAFDHGVTFFDTADTYSDGGAETILAEALPKNRDEMFIATKFGYDIYAHKPDENQRERPHNWEPSYLRFAVEKSLERLNTDRIDFYQLHNPRLDALQRDDLMTELEKLKSEGKILSYGAALGPAIDERQADETRYILNNTKMAGVQIIYNLLEQQVGAPIFQEAREKGVGILTRVPHASGLLEGNLDTETVFPPGDHRNWRMTTNEKKKLWLNRGLLKVEKLAFLTEGTGRTMGQAALQFILSEPSIVSVLPNIYDAPQLLELVRTTDVPMLTQSELNQIWDLHRNDFYLDTIEPLDTMANVA
jgi:aryl-alcohol dehydrogenase-like predicted oxidoreductase